jgi:hypothetical protein
LFLLRLLSTKYPSNIAFLLSIMTNFFTMISLRILSLNSYKLQVEEVA